MCSYGEVSDGFGGEEDLLGRGEDDDSPSGSSCTGCAAQTVDVLVAVGGKAYLKDKCHSTMMNGSIMSEEDISMLDRTYPGKSIPLAATSELSKMALFASLKFSAAFVRADWLFLLWMSYSFGRPGMLERSS